jgi:hypothetical protein
VRRKRVWVRGVEIERTVWTEYEALVGTHWVSECTVRRTETEYKNDGGR